MTVLFVFVLGLPLTGRAATVGNPAEVVGAAGRFSLGVEYDGVTGRDLDIPYTVEIDGKGEADSNFGVFLGTDVYVIPNRLSVNVEGRFLDETAFSLGATYRF